MAVSMWKAWLLALISLCPFIGPVAGQYPQNYALRVNASTGETERFITFTPGGREYKVYNTTTWGYTVHLFYNCKYMREICLNIDKFLATPRGRSLHSDKLLDPEGGDFRYYAYDANTAPPGVKSGYRDTDRRDASCKNFKSRGTCPEPDQMLPMRHDGLWFTSRTKANTYNIQDVVNQITGNLIRASGIIYTCEEFPAASWVEGGNGPNRNTPANTRCVPMTCSNCPRFTKAEQNWQSQLHAAVARKLKAAFAKQTQHAWENKHTIALFKFSRVPDSPTRPNDGIVLRPASDSTEGVGQRQIVVADKGPIATRLIETR
ncbi:hypothetical protein B0T16DRAFT_69721 [Cercophora newfieldiana]|uniref:RHS repeat-associated core domain-containing protein n=1 Tax=Cercophora newfieldiana TaxID=92897 RepID=A0AA39YSR3_9PEZI|nr:hypothetical protein B0T16DRAFT_69721 [Cercophora newfieldiana]